MPCQGCYKKQLRIDSLEEQVIGLRHKLRYEERKTKEGYFGSSTPSSKKPFKKNAEQKLKQKKNGGAKKGHKGYGRKSLAEEEADIIETLSIPDKCPDCNRKLINKDTVNRTVIDSVPIKAKKILYKCEKKWCPRCHKTITKKPVVLPKALFGNQLIAQAAGLHYGHGVPLGRVEEILSRVAGTGSLHDIFHRIARLWQPAISKLINEYRKSKVKHADETGWRTDGNSGFAWIFCTEAISIFQFKDNRSSKVARAILGERKLPGVLVVDRYNAYNKSPCEIQYCYSHLLRKAEDTGKLFIDNPEVQNFVGVFAPLLSNAMHLRTTDITDKIYYKKAKSLKKEILKAVNSPADHLCIKEIQLIFKENKKRLYHWCKNRKIPAENNRAERELRPTVIARKVSFGSQSEQGAATRSVLMTILNTAKKRLKEQSLESWFKQALDKIVLNPTVDPYSLLPPHG